MKRHLLLLFLILLVGFFFRTYQIVEQYEFGHDGDLYSWIVKDIVVNGHFRLIGQITSAPGIFIGPAFYYLLVPFFLMTNMDPIGALIPTVLIGLTTIFSLYFIISKLFSKEAGLISAFLYAVLISTVNFDRWVVPTITASLWTIWYLYTILMIVRGKFSVIPLLGILIGLIWHVHIALLPTLIAIPAAVFLSKKFPTKKQIIFFLIFLLITSLPFLLFEARHNFSQINALVENFSSSHQGGSGISKSVNVLSMISKNVNTLFLSPQSLPENIRPIFSLLLIFTIFFIPFKGGFISKKEIATLAIWMLGVIGFFSVSSTLISEYYFHNINIIFLLLTSLTIYLIFKQSKIGKILILSILAIILFKNLYAHINTYIYHKGYLEKKAVVDFIKTDSLEKGFPCIGVSYITAPGENVGFRYFFYLSQLNMIHPSLEVPVYNIFIPEEFSNSDERKIFGHIGVTAPTFIPKDEVIKKSCEAPNSNLSDPVLGYVE